MIQLEDERTDNSINYNYHDEDTLYFVNFKNLLLAAFSGSCVCTSIFAVFESIQSDDHAIGIIVVSYLLYIGTMIFQIFILFNYRFLLKKGLKKFSWISCLFIIVHSVFYIVIINIILIGGPDLMNKLS